MTDIALAKIIAKVEGSEAGARAIRFEDAFYGRLGVSPNAAESAVLATIAHLHKCSQHTARMIAASSWGTYQLMGLSLYELGWASDVFDFIGDAVKQADMFGQFLAKHGIDFTWADLVSDTAKRQEFIDRYNGPAQPDAYWALCVSAAKALGLPTV